MVTIKLSGAQVEALSVLLYHTRRDLDYGVQGSFGDSEVIYKREYNQTIKIHNYLARSINAKEYFTTEMIIKKGVK